LFALQVAKSCFVPALLGHAIEDDFIRPHHSDRILEAYMVNMFARIWVKYVLLGQCYGSSTNYYFYTSHFLFLSSSWLLILVCLTFWSKHGLFVLCRETKT